MSQVLNAYLQTAMEYYRQDKLDVAMQVINDAMQTVGWPEGLWTEFLNRLTCEKDARDGAEHHIVNDKLSIELDRNAPVSAYEQLKSTALEAMKRVANALQVEYRRPILITVFRADAATEFIAGPHGYVSHKSEHDKICFPWNLLFSHPEYLLKALVHELTHCAVYELGGEISAWINEGLAMYVSQDLLHANWPVIIRLANRLELALIARLNGLLSSADERKDEPQAVLASYYLAGSLVQWWAGNIGLDTVRDALVRMGNGESEEHAIKCATGVSRGEIEKKWRQSLQVSSSS